MTANRLMFLLFASGAFMGFIVGHPVGWFTFGACVMLACVIGVDR